MENKAITVRMLKDLCDEQIKKGNGDKEILLSDDDEDNGFHTLFCGFTDDPDVIQEINEFSCFHDDNDPNKVVILG